jgi:hypothetical protein
VCGLVLASLQCLLAEAYLGFIDNGIEALIFMDALICFVCCGDLSQLSAFESGLGGSKVSEQFACKAGGGVFELV